MQETAVSNFNVLDRNQTIHRHAILEASAGTGKTFAIENIVIRLLIEKANPLPIEKILVVTFTKAATRDLKERINSNLEKSLKILRAASTNSPLPDCPDYLLECIEKGPEAIKKAQRLIEQALFSYDQAQIFTIHGFCWRMLKIFAIEGNLSLEAASKEEQPRLTTKLLQAIHDFLRTELHPDHYSPEQLKILLKRSKNKIEKLQEDLLREVNKGIKIASYPSFHDLFLLYQNAMPSLISTHSFEAEKIISDFHVRVPSYNGVRTTSKEIHPEILQQLHRFAALFDKNSWSEKEFDILIKDGLFLIEIFAASKLSKKGPPLSNSLHYPDFLQILQNSLGTIVSQARNEAFLFSRLAHDCQKFVRRYQVEEELLGNSDLLLEMGQAIKNPAFSNCIRTTYNAAIIDEFQDTDPIQWEIFSSLFFNTTNPWNGFLYLIGDPKQSIYAFRQADIYTYLSAANLLGKDSLATLDTNYRSQPALINALNTLFESTSDLFPLPRLSNSQSLPYRPVNAGKNENFHFKDNLPCLQFWIAKGNNKKEAIKSCELNFFLPAITQEILRLHAEDHIRFSQCAILVSDRHQAERVSQFLSTHNIPTKNQRATDLSNSTAVPAMREIIQGILNYRDTSSLNIALGNKIIGMSHQEILALMAEGIEALLIKCDRLRHTLINNSFAQFYHEFMHTSWHAHGLTSLQQLLSYKQGYQFYREWQDIADILIDAQAKETLSPEGLIAFLDEFDTLSQNDDSRIKSYTDPDEEGVAILTTFVSKGLEFDFVFTLGLSNRTPSSENKLILLQNESHQYLGAIEDQNDPKYLSYCEEIDAEKMRQLYVALTRAKYRLYIPTVIADEELKISLGSASPLELFLARLNLKKASSYEELYQRINNLNPSLISFLTTLNQNIYLKFLDDSPISTPIISTQTPSLTQPKDVFIPGTSLFMQSFSSISLVHPKEKMLNELKEKEGKEGKEGNAPHDFASEQKTAYTLPSGNEIGLLLHHILEILPFHCVKTSASTYSPKNLSQWITPIVQDSSFAAWERVITDLIFKSLTTPLGGSFCLADINPKKIYRETEFLFPYNDHTLFQGANIRAGYIKGIIDLFFEHEGKYYLLDWKSNWLGPTQEHYQHKNMEEAMFLNHYDLQGNIYKEAVKRYLNMFQPNLFETNFGGIYYIFMRGISPTSGIWKDV